MKRFFLILATFASLQICSGQVQLITPPKFQSFLANGETNAFGCVFTYSTGTSTPLATYTDYTGATSNANPVVLDAGGFANIWYQNGLEYRVVVKTAGGVNCVSGSTLYTVDGLNQGLLNTSNIWQQPQIFDDPIQILAPDLQILFGSPSGTQTTLDIPPTSQNLVLRGPPLTNANDTLVAQNTVQSLSNKNLTTGTELNGCGMTFFPGTYLCIANNSTNATVLRSLTILTGAPSTATLALTTSNAGIVGVTTANAGITGTAVIQQTGVTGCNFDGATTAGDYVVPSTSVAGDCRDSGVAPGGVVTSLVLGIVLASGSSGSELVDLFGPNITNSLGGTPAVVYGGGSGGAGIGAIISLTSGSVDKVGTVTVVTGGSPAASPGNLFNLTFSTPFPTFASCTFSPANNNSSTITAIAMSASASGFDMNYTSSSALTGSTSYVWNYLCNGY